METVAPFVLVFGENLVHWLNGEVSKVMPLSTHIVCVKLKVEFKASDGFVLPALCIMFKPIETRCSSPIHEARHPIWPVMIEHLRIYQHKQQPLTF